MPPKEDILPSFWNRAIVQVIGQSPVFGLLCWIVMYGQPADRNVMLAEMREQRAHDAAQTKEIVENQKLVVSTLKDLSREMRYLADMRRPSPATQGKIP